MKMSGNTILITGGNSGIGQALAHQFHDRGNTVIVAGRDSERLRAAVEGRPNMHAVTFDAGRDPAAEFARSVLWEHPALNVLVNMAGIMRWEAIGASRDLSDAEETVVTNLLVPIRLIDAFVDHLKRQVDSAIVNVSSGLAFVPHVKAPTYSATKAAIHSYSVSLREALAGQVEVIELAPPAVRTGLTPGQEAKEEYMPLDEFVSEVMDLFAQEPTPSEILVKRVSFLRFAERESRFDDAVKAIAGH